MSSETSSETSTTTNAMINALDTFTPVQTGENGHVELAWSNDLQERIVQFDFQCVRTDKDGVASLAAKLDDLLRELKVSTSSQRNNYLTYLYKIIGKTRDINGGKGEYTLSYMMIHVWHNHFPQLAEAALKFFVVDPFDVDITNTSQEPYGSWKDMKYLCKYLLDNDCVVSHPLVKCCVQTINQMLRKDDELYCSLPKSELLSQAIAVESTVKTVAVDTVKTVEEGEIVEEKEKDKDTNKSLSLVSKWIPREESGKFGFLYDQLAMDYFQHYLTTSKTTESFKKAMNKARTHYRILCSKLNRHLDTVQIKQTAGRWAEIDHAKTTSITMLKQRAAFMNKPGKGKKAEQGKPVDPDEDAADVRSTDPDRIKCAENLTAYLDSLKKEGKEVKGKNIGLDKFTIEAFRLLQTNGGKGNQEEVDMLDSQWRDNSNKKNANGLGPMIAIVDTSGSMSGDPLNAAIALGCRVAEKSCLGKRVMTFATDPRWINLDGCDTFTSMVQTIYKSSHSAGLSTDFYKALQLILSAIEEKRVPPADVENMILAIFSDMQIDDCMNGGTPCYDATRQEANRAKMQTMHEQIKQRYSDLGMRLYGVPLNPPHILFWNLRKTSGFPTMSTVAGCSMMSGFDPTILNMFCELGMEALKNMTPFNTLLRLLENNRYDPLEKEINKTF